MKFVHCRVAHFDSPEVGTPRGWSAMTSAYWPSQKHWTHGRRADEEGRCEADQVSDDDGRDAQQTIADERAAYHLARKAWFSSLVALYLGVKAGRLLGRVLLRVQRFTTYRRHVVDVLFVRARHGLADEQDGAAQQQRGQNDGLDLLWLPRVMLAGGFAMPSPREHSPLVFEELMNLHALAAQTGSGLKIPEFAALGSPTEQRKELSVALRALRARAGAGAEGAAASAAVGVGADAAESIAGAASDGDDASCCPSRRGRCSPNVFQRLQPEGDQLDMCLEMLRSQVGEQCQNVRTLSPRPHVTSTCARAQAAQLEQVTMIDQPNLITRKIHAFSYE